MRKVNCAGIDRAAKNLAGYRRFESISLQQRVCEPSVPRGSVHAETGIFRCVGAVSKVVPLDLVIPGCSRRRRNYLKGLLILLSVR